MTDNPIALSSNQCGHTPLFAQDPVRWAERVTPCLYCKIESLTHKLRSARDLLSGEFYSEALGELDNALDGRADETTTPQWINVQDRYPEVGQDVVYYFDECGTYIGKYLGEHCFAGDMGFLTDDVTHWMPYRARRAVKATTPLCPWCGGQHIGTDCTAEKANALGK